jgi:hypothetical protein
MDGDSEVRKATIEALGRIDDTRAVAAYTIARTRRFSDRGSESPSRPGRVSFDLEALHRY